MKKFFAVILFFIILASLPAQNARFAADSRIADEACLSEVMTSEVFAKTALIASGANDDEVSYFFEQMKNLSSMLKNEISEQSITEKKQAAEFTLSFLYNHVLNSYSLDQTRVDTALKSGVYNCVSSCVLFMYLIKTLDIQVAAVETPMHSFCSVFIDGRKIDVETTNPYGFDPGVKRDISQGSAIKKYVIVPAKNYYNRKDVDDRRILSIIYNNRIASLQKQKNNFAAVGLAFDAGRLQNNSPQSLDIIKQCIINCAVEFSSQQKDKEGLSFIAEAVFILGDNEDFLNYREETVGSILNNFIQKNDYNSAGLLLKTYKEQISLPCYSQYFTIITVNRLNYTIKQSEFDAAYKAVKNSREILSESDYKKLLSYAYACQADKIARSGSYLQAGKFLDEALQELPGDSALQQQRQIFRHNYAIGIHNQAVKLVNEGNLEGARKILNEGLSVVSESSILKNDLSRLK